MALILNRRPVLVVDDSWQKLYGTNLSMLLDVLPGASVASSRPHNAVEIASVKALRAALASRPRPSQPMYTRLDWWYNTGNAGELIALGTPTGASKDCLAECRLICDSRFRAPVRDSRPAPRRRESSAC